MNSVTVIGSFNVDHVWRCESLPAPGATLSGRYSTGPGGKGFNQAVASARAGAPTRFLCALGDDAGGTLARRLAADDGIELLAMTSDEPTGSAGIYVEHRGRNTIVVGPGANASLDAAFIDAHRQALVRSTVVLVQLESPLETVVHALQLAREAGVTTILNPAPANAPSSMTLRGLADVLTPNETEFAALLQRYVGERVPPEDVASLDGMRLHALCRQLMPEGSIVLTLGAVGAFISHPDTALRGDAQPYYRIAAEPVQAIDTTGAGDAFNGALAAALARDPDAPFQQQVRFANRYAGRSTERTGAALAMPRLDELTPPSD